MNMTAEQETIMATARRAIIAIAEAEAMRLASETLWVHRECETLVTKVFVVNDRTTNGDCPERHPFLCDVCWNASHDDMTLLDGFDSDELQRFIDHLLSK